MPRKQTFHLRHKRPREPEETDVYRGELTKMCERWCEVYGYTVAESSWEIRPVPMDPYFPDDVETVLTATLEARWDGVWGDLRGALLEDGLLDPEDAAPPVWTGADGTLHITGTLTAGSITATDLSASSITSYFAPSAPPSPSVGDTWYHTDDSSMRRWDGSTWVKITPLPPEMIYAEASKVDPWPTEPVNWAPDQEIIDTYRLPPPLHRRS